jgi:hypothetical protein
VDENREHGVSSVSSRFLTTCGMALSGAPLWGRVTWLTRRLTRRRQNPCSPSPICS